MHMQAHTYAHMQLHLHMSHCVYVACCLSLFGTLVLHLLVIHLSLHQMANSRGSAPPRRGRFKASHVKHCFFRTLLVLEPALVAALVEEAAFVAALALLLVPALVAALVKELEELVQALVLLSMPSAGPATEAIAAAAAPSVAEMMPLHVLEA